MACTIASIVGSSTSSEMSDKDFQAMQHIVSQLTEAWQDLPTDQSLPHPPWVIKGARSAYNTAEALAKDWAEWVKQNEKWQFKHGRRVGERDFGDVAPTWCFLSFGLVDTWGNFLSSLARQGYRTTIVKGTNETT